MPIDLSPEFKPFPSISRLSREIVITEKLDGTNALVCITEHGDIYAGSRTRWITPTDDNYGFARWAEGNKEELLKLGAGYHYGEWWGQGIQRGYGLKEKRFSLFNVTRWRDEMVRPACCQVVPLLGIGPRLDTTAITFYLDQLGQLGSIAAPGFMKPEGIVVYHGHSNTLFKKTLENDDKGKSYGA